MSETETHFAQLKPQPKPTHHSPTHPPTRLPACPPARPPTHLEYIKKRETIHVMSVSAWTGRLGMACRMELTMLRPLMVPRVMP